MDAVLPFRQRRVGSADTARTHFILRFSAGTTASFVTCEWLGWQPSALAPVLTAVLLANLPVAPPGKVGLVLVVVMALCAWSSFFLTTFLGQVPHLLFAIIGIVMFLAFANLAKARGQLPLTFLLICISVVPVVTLTLSQYAGILPGLLVRAMALAVIFTWLSFALWPSPSPKSAEPQATPLDSPLLAAGLGTAIVLPVMLVHLLFGLTDAIPVLLTTVLLVAKMETERGASSGLAKVIGNFAGGMVAVAAYYVLQLAPSLLMLGLVTFLIGAGFAAHIVKGDVRGGNALIAYNATMVILGLALLKGPSNSGVWATRILQFGLASLYAVAMMRLLWPVLDRRSGFAASQNPASRT